MQNRSHAVMAQRVEPTKSLDDFPTPPWATRALMTYVIADRGPFKNQCCFEPACGAEHMARPLKEFFGEVLASDIHPFGYGNVADFIASPNPAKSVDWIITNPPFRLAEAFIKQSILVARRGIAILARTVFIESVGRYREVFVANPPSRFAQFTERVPMVKGRLDKSASTATGYAWLVWELDRETTPRLMWIPPCRKSLEQAGDYRD